MYKLFNPPNIVLIHKIASNSVIVTAFNNIQYEFPPQDVKGYYTSINHAMLLSLAEKYIPDCSFLRLLWLYLKRTSCFGGNYREVSQGVSLG
jgi:hypothetical protein